MRQGRATESQVANARTESPPRGSWLLVVAVITAGFLAAINLFHSFGPIHLHDDGPLGSLSGAGFAFDSHSTGPWTMGYELCLAQASDPVIIESVSPASRVGGRLNYLGAFVREIPGLAVDSTRTGAIGGTGGFPPTVSETLRPVAGYHVTHQCASNGAQSPYTELDIGIGRNADSIPGGWGGYTVDYRVGTTEYVVTWDTGIYDCGAHLPASAVCIAPT